MPGSQRSSTLAERGVAVTWARGAAARVRAAGLDPATLAGLLHEVGHGVQPDHVRLRWRSGRTRPRYDVSAIAVVSDHGLRVISVEITKRGG